MPEEVGVSVIWQDLDGTEHSECPDHHSTTAARDGALAMRSYVS